MCGGTAQTTQQVSIPPDVLARYNAVNARAEQVAQKPFQQYSTDPNAFVAPINQTQQAGIQNIGAAQNIAQPYFQNATQQLMGGQAAATPYYGEATQQLLGGLNAGMTGTQAAYQPMAQAAQYAQNLQGGALGQYQGALQAAQPYNQAAGEYAQTGLAAATPYYGQAAQNIAGAQDVGTALGGASLNALQQAGQAAQPLQGSAAENISSAAAAAQPLNQAAIRSIMQGNRAAQPLQQQAAAGIGAAQAGAQPYQQLATQFGLSGAQAVNAGPLGGEQINQYMSPYLQSVVGSTMANLRQQQGQEQSSLLGNQIAQGAFGGDRGRIAQANLARQQELATGQTVAGLMNQGYGQALQTAQQQQQLGLGAAQANRAAQQQAAQQMLGIGQQGFGQGLATAQQQAALGQQLYGQGLGSGQALAGIGQQQYGQQLGTGQAQAALGSQLFGQGAQTAQQQAALGQQLYGQGMGAAQAQQGLGQGLYGMGTGMGSFMQGLGQQNYAQQTGLGQNLAQLAQQGFGQGAAQTAQQAALAQQQYGMGAGAAGQMAGLGQGLYGMGAGTAQALAGMGTQAQQNALGAAQAQLGAGTVQQQTEQAGKQALYNQFLQQQGYDFQTAQFLANIAMGTGALSGSTTATTQPMPFFSDKRLKEAVEPIGETYDGQKIVKFRYKNEPGTRIGLIAQDVEKHHPDAVGLAGGYKTVDYDAATKDAAAKGHYARGGLAPESEGGAVVPFPMRRGFAVGGNSAQLIGNDELSAILQAQFGMYGNQGIPGLGGTPGATGFVPAGSLPVGKLTVAGDAPELPKDDLSTAVDDAKGVVEAYKGGRDAYNEVKSWFDDKKKEYRGGLVGHYASGGASMGPYGIPLDTGETPELMTAGKAPKPPKSTFETIMDTVGGLGNLASSINNPTKAAGGAAEGDVGSGTPYEAGSNPYMPKSANSVQKAKELAKPGEAPDAPESGFGQAMHFAKDVAGIAALAAMLKRGGRVGKLGGGSLEDEDDTQVGGIPRPAKIEQEQLPDISSPEKREMTEAALSYIKSSQQAQQAQQAPVSQAPVSQAPAPQATAARYANVPFEQVQSDIISGENKGLADPYNSVYGAGKYGTMDGGPSTRTIGEVQDFQRNTLIPATRGKIAGVSPNMGTGAAGAYGFTYGTLGSIAPQVFGKDWRNVPFNQENQDKMARALYEQNRGSDANLAKQWAAFSGINPTGRALQIQSGGLQPPNIQTADVGPDVDSTPPVNLASTASDNRGLAGQYAQADTGIKTDAAPAGLQPSSRVPMPKPDIEAGPYNRTERILLPILAGLGSMAGSRNRYGLGALLEGVGGGASAYAQMQAEQYKKGQEQQQKGIEAQLAGAQTKVAETSAIKTQMELWTKLSEQIAAVIRAGGVPPQYLISARDEAAKKLLSQGVNPETLKLQPTAQAISPPVKVGKPEERPTEGGIPSSIYERLNPNDNPQTLRQRAAQVAVLDPALSQSLMDQARTATEKLREGTVVDNEGNVIIVPGALSAKAASEGQKIDIGITGATLERQREANRNATATLNRIAQMSHEMENIPDSGFLTPGSGAFQRQEWAKNANTFLSAVGAQPLFDPNVIASNEQLFKDSTRLGFELSSSFDNTGAQQIVQQSIGATPTIANTKDGYRRITASLAEVAKYEQLRTAFYEDWARSHNWSLAGAEEAFTKANPPEKFAMEALVNSVPRDMVKKARDVAATDNKGLSAARAAYDGRFGKGVFDAIRGGK